MEIALFGKGKMGTQVASVAKSRGHKTVPFENAEMCIDFSHASVVLPHLEQALERQIPIVIGTTGWDEKVCEAQTLVLAKGGAALYAPNFSLGVALFLQIAKHAAKLMAAFPEYDIAGVELHHNQKQDAPSGTAKQIASLFNPPPTFASVRCGAIAGTHTLLFDSPSDSITLTHEARGREGFAQGAVRAAEWLLGKTGWFTLDDLYSAHHSL